MKLDLEKQEAAALVMILEQGLKATGIAGLMAKIQAAQAEKPPEASDGDSLDAE